MFCQCIHPTPPKKTQLIWKTFQCEPQRCIAACPLTNFVVNNVKVSCQRSDGCFSVRSDVESRRPAVRRRPGCFHCHEFDSLWINHLFFILFSRAWQANVRKIIRLLVVRAICFFSCIWTNFRMQKKNNWWKSDWARGCWPSRIQSYEEILPARLEVCACVGVRLFHYSQLQWWAEFFEWFVCTLHLVRVFSTISPQYVYRHVFSTSET